MRAALRSWWRSLVDPGVEDYLPSRRAQASAARDAARRRAFELDVADYQAALQPPRRRYTPTPLFDQARHATGVDPQPSGLDVDALLAELDLLALPIATGTLRVRKPS